MIRTALFWLAWHVPFYRVRLGFVNPWLLGLAIGRRPHKIED